jgi:hypothetical protein
MAVVYPAFFRSSKLTDGSRKVKNLSHREIAPLEFAAYLARDFPPNRKARRVA